MPKRENILRLFLLVTVVTFLFPGCKKEEAPKENIPTDIFYRQMTSLALEVAYEPGAEPYDFKITGENIWEFTEANIESLFAERPVPIDVTVPNGLAEMTLIPDQNKNGFSLDEIKDIAEVYRKVAGNETSGNIFIVFLNGYYEQADTLVTNIMGLNITGATITAIFKPLVSASHGNRIVREFVEQSVVIHETGHALGLVNNGVPVTTDHHDDGHGAHCTNEDCVMYWQNERTATITSFVQNYYQGNNVAIFGPECLKDTREYFPE